MDHVTVEGNDSLFMFHGKMTTFATIGCEDVEFKDFAVDFQVPTVIDMTVESVEEIQRRFTFLSVTIMRFQEQQSPGTVM